jgi:ATP-dependent Zn protease
MGKSGRIGDFRAYSPYQGQMISDQTKQQLEEDVQDILRTCMDDVRKFLTEHKDLLDHFAHELVAKEELEFDDIQAIFKKFGVKFAAPRA